MNSVIDQQYAKAVDARLNSYEDYIAYQMYEAKRALAFLAKFIRIKDARVLEIGTGRGGKGIAYALAGMHVTALDIDWEALRLGAQAGQAQHADIHFLAGNGEQLAFPANHFDAILLDSVLEHVQHPAAVLQECYRVLKPGGIVFVVFPPFYGPLSGHIDDYVLIPWFHVLPRAIVKKYLLGIDARQGILTSQDTYQVFATLNGLTVWQFKRAARRAHFHFDYLMVRPFLTHPGMRLVAGFVAAMRHPSRAQNLRQVFSRARREFDLGTFALFLLLTALAPLVLLPILQEIAAGGCKAVLRKPQ